jgi:hypothetical protein
MEQSDVTTLAGDPPEVHEEETAFAVEVRPTAVPSPQPTADPCNCGRPGGACVCGAAETVAPEDGGGAVAPQYIYAIGRIEPRAPTVAVERELVQVTGQAETAGLTDRQALHDVLSKRENRYLARQLCFVLMIGGLETYILGPRDPSDFDQLIDAVRPAPGPLDMDLVIGMRGPIAPPELCNGLTIPIVGFDQIYSFDRDSLVKSIPRPSGMTAKQFEPAATEVLDRIMQVADNAGASDEHRALNYLAVRYPEIYSRAVDAFGRDFALTGVGVVASPITGLRNLVDVVLTFRTRTSDFVERYFVRVDVTEEFPFLVTPLTPYVER